MPDIVVPTIADPRQPPQTSAPALQSHRSPAASDTAPAPAGLIASASPTAAPVQSPPPAQRLVDEPQVDARAALHQLARELVRTHNRRLLIEYLRLRRAVR